MKTNEMVKDYLFRAKWCLKEAEMALSGKNNPMCVRRSQEALELVTKALLRSMAIEYPREHDVGDSLAYIEKNLPDYLKSEIPSLKSLLTELSRVRGPAFYGYEREAIPASEAFSSEYASDTFKRVSRVIDLCEKYLQTIL
ncbi:HEPN domain-containing protein [groundwater metagenome]